MKTCPCVCVDADAYVCWRSRYRSDWVNTREEVIEDGGPCRCMCHKDDDDEDDIEL